MKKIVSVLLCPVCLCTAFSLAASAHPDRLVDGAGLLTAYEEEFLRGKLDEVSERYDIDIVIIRTDTWRRRR